jgi:hypothetical protein
MDLIVQCNEIHPEALVYRLPTVTGHFHFCTVCAAQRKGRISQYMLSIPPCDS